MARTPEGKVRDHLKKKVEALGGEVRAMKWLGRNGAPDVLALLPELQARRMYRTHWKVEAEVHYLGPWMHPLIETKAKNGVPGPHQLREHERLRRAGFVVLVLSTLEQIDEVFG
jgi:hypothetical protein